MDSRKSYKEEFTGFIQNLQEDICNAIEKLEGEARFTEDVWTREGGGGGRTRVISKGKVIEKGGVNISRVHGELPAQMKEYLKVDHNQFFACGISLVIHPHNPFVPTVHANFRYFELYNQEGVIKDQWFAGGADLTPYYLFEEDGLHFHTVYKTVCDKFDPHYYVQYKKACDAYFFNHHRGEARGVGGIFFDYLKPDSQRTLEHWYNFTTSVAKQWADSYLPILEKRKNSIFTEKHKYWQEIRRGRYVEFNLIHDKGTLFGLRTNGRIESILMSLPSTVRWDYNFEPEVNSPEDELLSVLKNPKDWISI